MENYLSIGSYSISSDGMSINYTAPSILPKEMVEKITSQEPSEVENIGTENKNISFDTLLKGVLSVPNIKQKNVK